MFIADLQCDTVVIINNNFFTKVKKEKILGKYRCRVECLLSCNIYSSITLQSLSVLIKSYIVLKYVWILVFFGNSTYCLPLLFI